MSDAQPTASPTERRLPHRHLVFLDGTWNSDDREGEQTHIVRLRNLAVPKPTIGDGSDETIVRIQTIYYDSGVGTDLGLLDRFSGGVFGVGLGEKVRQAYRHLSGVYEPGDEICVFGFSRGAYTARSLVGYIGAAGLLKRAACTADAEAAAWSYYRTAPKKRSPGANAERATLVQTDVRIRTMGVFDTVGALGIPMSGVRLLNRWLLQFHDTEVSRIVDYAFHAVAIDEKRKPFEAAVWQNPFHEDFRKVEQVWFPGVHSDIGGGYPEHRLGDIPLHWMIDRLVGGPGTQERGPHVDLNAYAHRRPGAVEANEGQPYETKSSLTEPEKPPGPRRLGPIEPDEATRTDGLLDDPLAPQNESRTALYRTLYRKPLLRLINQAWPPGDRQKIRRKFYVNAFQPFQAPMGEMVHWSALVRLGRPIATVETHPSKSRRHLYAPVNLVAVLPSILMTYTGKRHDVFGSQQDALDKMKALATFLEERGHDDLSIRKLHVVRHVPDLETGWRAHELDPANDADCAIVLAQLLRLFIAGYLKAA